MCLRVSRSKIGQRRPEDEMSECTMYYFTDPSEDSISFPSHADGIANFHSWNWRVYRVRVSVSPIRFCAFTHLRFRSNLVHLNERNRRNSCAILRVSRLKIGQRWPEDEMS